MKAWIIALSGAAVLLMSGCGETADNFSASDAVGGYVVMDTKGGDIPYPNDILFAPAEGQPADGTVNIPFDPSDKDAAVKAALDTLDGFSTTAPISVSVSNDIDSATLPGNLHFYRVDATESNATSPVPVVIKIVSELSFGQDYVATYSNGKIAILPLKPLESHTHYMVLMTNGIKTATGKAIEPDYVTSLLINNTPLFDAAGKPTVILDSDPDVNKATLVQLAGIQQLTQQMLSVAQRDQNITSSDVVSVWSFTTQSIGKVAKAIAQNGTSDAYLGLQDTNATSKDMLMAYYAGLGDSAKVAEINATMTGNAEVYAGILANLPYYLALPTPEDPTAPITESFVFTAGSDMPQERGRVTIPVLAAVPGSSSGCTEPSEGWPVAIFQHGITRNRLDILAISEAFAKICYAVVGIDLPLHGIADPTNPLYDKDHERTFNLDFLTQDENETILAKVPDGKPDTSGIHYINFVSLLTARDNIRQSTSDYIALQNAIASAQKNVNGLNFDESKIAYVGHSLGTIAPFGYFSYQDEAGLSLATVLLSMPGGGITDIMLNSQTFGDAVIEGLKGAGLEPGTNEFAAFTVAMQTILDDADPLNYANKVAEKQRLLLHLVKDDDVIPNTVAAAPLAGGVPIVHLMGAKDITSYFAEGETTKTIFPETSDDVYTFFQSGNHRSLFIPDYNLDTTIEMQTQMDSFIYSQGVAIDANLSRIVN
ncbi:hypothetical protein [Hydrogenimonas cancrithermarum]|uniref:Lipase n=1 Tax=Hydrogenimonas cancrithermarum TaxID=2993563 RepID=A0ABM8FLN6_9BACT|nr:hypothetical protein [Hydrogenimonas cancrithermarum]BDY13277.1 lipase [Hydrogenimonas cancrithermarum]